MKNVICALHLRISVWIMGGAVAAVLLAGCGTSGGPVISTVAGTGHVGSSGNGGLATAATLGQPTCVALDSAGNMYIGDVQENTVRKVTAATGVISAYAGNGSSNYTGDGGQATNASLYGPTSCVLDAAGNLYVADEANNVVRKIMASTGIITTDAGNGYEAGTSFGGFSGDGGQAIFAELNHPWGVAIDSAGDLFIADTGNSRIREVSGSTGIITTIGTFDNGTNPQGLALDGAGNLYVAEQGKCQVSKLNLSTKAITTVAGNGTFGEGASVVGDGGPATSAVLAAPQGVILDAAGDIFIADSNNQRVREVKATTGIITTVAGTTVGYSGDGGAATSAKLHNPEQMFFDASGNLYIADSYNSAIRKVIGLN